MESVAVLLAVYFRDDPILFERALMSVITQEMPRQTSIRIYLGIDGPLSPALEEVVQKYSDCIYKICKSESNVGLAATLNNLISCRQDESYFFRMDADDISLPGRFRAQLEFFEKNADIDILGTDIREVDMATGKQRTVSFCRGALDAERTIAKRVPVAHPTVCFRRRVFDKVVGYPAAHGCNEDIAMWFACMEKNLKFDNVPEVYLQFTISADFWKRRSYRKAFLECFCYMSGIFRIEGPTWRYVYPLARLVMRLSPAKISKIMYGSRLLRGNRSIHLTDRTEELTVSG